MADEDLIRDLLGDRVKPSRWAVMALVASCTFAAGALALLILSLV